MHSCGGKSFRIPRESNLAQPTTSQELCKSFRNYLVGEDISLIKNVTFQNPTFLNLLIDFITSVHEAGPTSHKNLLINSKMQTLIFISDTPPSHTRKLRDKTSEKKTVLGQVVDRSSRGGSVDAPIGWKKSAKSCLLARHSLL